MADNLHELTIDLLPVEREDTAVALESFVAFGPQGVTTCDATHTAVMAKNGLKTIISTDRHFDRLPEIERIDPLELFSAASAEPTPLP